MEVVMDPIFNQGFVVCTNPNLDNLEFLRTYFFYEDRSDNVVMVTSCDKHPMRSNSRAVAVMDPRQFKESFSSRMTYYLKLDRSILEYDLDYEKYDIEFVEVFKKFGIFKKTLSTRYKFCKYNNHIDHKILVNVVLPIKALITDHIEVYNTFSDSIKMCIDNLSSIYSDSTLMSISDEIDKIVRNTSLLIQEYYKFAIDNIDTSLDPQSEALSNYNASLELMIKNMKEINKI
ncbi:hypothetical protein LIS04_38 [Listeria phage LIS04]|nr:hypothetical protein LIS04_38 [Listeria phage LIS04]